MPPTRKEDEALLEQLRLAARRIAGPFGLAFRSLRKTRRDARIYGSCDTEGAIRIRLRSRVTGAFLSRPSLIATLCHELAHLRHFDHGPEFAALYRRLLGTARALGLFGPAHVRRALVADAAKRPALAASARPRRRSRVRASRRAG